MPREPSTIDFGNSRSSDAENEVRSVPGLMIAWSAEEPQRVGEVALFELDGLGRILGRGEASDDGG
jgi:hypothetical protein